MVLTYSSLIDLPWGIYMTFVLEDRHGFNKQVCDSGSSFNFVFICYYS